MAVEPNAKYVLCDSERAVDLALGELRSCSLLALDCEGDKLGTTSGKLSLLNIRTLGPGRSSSTFLFDVIALGQTGMRPVFDMMASPNVLKVVFDGRMDDSALFHEHGVGLVQVIDLQLVDIASRAARGEGSDKRKERLCGYIRSGDVYGGTGHMYDHIQKLLGLKSVLQEHCIDDAAGNGSPKVSHDLWLKRPLTKEYLDYAAEDVRLIGLIHSHFQGRGYMTEGTTAQSLRYVSMWRSSQPDAQDAFKHHPLLPLQILDEEARPSICKDCNGCRRQLPQTSFSKTGWRLQNKRNCFVCHAVSRVLERRRQIERTVRDAEEYERYESNSDGGYYELSD